MTGTEIAPLCTKALASLRDSARTNGCFVCLAAVAATCEPKMSDDFLNGAVSKQRHGNDHPRRRESRESSLPRAVTLGLSKSVLYPLRWQVRLELSEF